MKEKNIKVFGNGFAPAQILYAIPSPLFSAPAELRMDISPHYNVLLPK